MEKRAQFEQDEVILVGGREDVYGSETSSTHRRHQTQSKEKLNSNEKRRTDDVVNDLILLVQHPSTTIKREVVVMLRIDIVVETYSPQT